MKILHCCEFFPPYVGGMPEVVSKLSSCMSKLGHDLHIATSRDPRRGTADTVIIDGLTIHQFDISGNISNGISSKQKENNRFVELIVDESFDSVAFFAAQQWAYDLGLLNLHRIKANKIFIPTGYSALDIKSYKSYFDFMKHAIRLFDHTIYLASDYRDINFGKREGANSYSIIPNGASKSDFLKEPESNNFREMYGIPQNSFLITCIASHTGLKGHRETIAAFAASKIEKSTLLVIGHQEKGHGCSEECQESAALFNAQNKNKRIVLLSLNRPEVIKALFSSQLFLLLSNLECSPIVLFEATAAGLPFVSTPAGNAEEIARWLNNGLICDASTDEAHPHGAIRADINNAAQLIEKVKSEYETYKSKASLARGTWIQSYTWEKIADRYLEVYTANKKEVSASQLEDYTSAISRYLVETSLCMLNSIQKQSSLVQELHDIRRSHSMRITAPIRNARRHIAHLRSIIKKEDTPSA